MARMLAAFLSLHWTMVFAVAASRHFAGQGETAGGFAAFSALATGSAGSGSLVLCIGNALIAVLFLWMLVSAVLERSPGHKETSEVARIAFGCAVLMTTAGLVADAVPPSDDAAMSAGMQLAALMASYLVVRFDRVPAPRAKSTEEPAAGGVARAMALEAVNELIASRPTSRSRDGRGG